MPYKKEFLKDRGVYEMLNQYKKVQDKLKLILLFRGGQTYKIIKDYCNINNINAKLINKNLTQKEMISLFEKSKIIIGLYTKGNIPKMPQSIIEGISCGCAAITTENTDLAELIKKEKAGIIIKHASEFSSAIKKILAKNTYNKNAFKLRDKYFNSNNNLKDYLKIYKQK